MAFKLRLEERSYGGKKFRPKPLCYVDPTSNLLLCITSWGQQDIDKEIIDSIKSFLTLATEDSEITVPYARKQNLERKGNVLRMSVIMASEKIFKDYNQEEYSAGFEIFAAIQEGPQWTYVSCGQPSLILNRQNMGTIPVNQNLDLNVQSVRTPLTDPLPNQLLGLGQHPPIQYGNIRVHKTDKIALVSRSYLPNSFFTIHREDFNQDNITRALAEDHQDIPFWLAMVNFD
ncbi:MAG: hypothetical protein KDD33_08205 [Bdellovibrionales bacterium]|nr:hypothetical protein [Bdellovibrionales bacterium]